MEESLQYAYFSEFRCAVSAVSSALVYRVAPLPLLLFSESQNLLQDPKYWHNNNLLQKLAATNPLF
jgi:hypothetical protein